RCSPKSTSSSSSGSSARSMPTGCSIRARCSRPSTAVPNLAACTSGAASCRSPTSPGSDGPVMSSVLRPETADQILEAVAWAAAAETPLEIVAGGTKRGIGRPLQVEHTLDVSGLVGITLYEPDELVLSARAGTPMTMIDAALAAEGQALAFEPPDLGPVLGGTAGGATSGGVLAANLGGPRRIKMGAARDHFLGLSAVSGRGEAFKSGGRVVKNVTGYDLCKVLAGSWGTLAVMTDVTIKVLPAPETEVTLVLDGLDARRGVAALC